MFELWRIGRKWGGMRPLVRTLVGSVCAIAALAVLACNRGDAAAALDLAPNAVLEIAVVRIDPARRAELPAIQAAEATAELVKKSAACQTYFALMRKEALFHHFKELL